ncbi:MAG: fasciclin domain-containing protein [Myxococcota bacterium]
MTVRWILVFSLAMLVVACDRGDATPEAAPAARTTAEPASNLPPLHPDNIVSIASGSQDHTTLVAALEAADYVTSVAASGPLTVFAPTNAAFDALPDGTVATLLEPENADQLRRVLQYHVTTSALEADGLRDGQTLGMANGKKTTVYRDGETLMVNDATVVASIPASNGMVHVIDKVLLPPE